MPAPKERLKKLKEAKKVRRLGLKKLIIPFAFIVLTYLLFTRLTHFSKESKLTVVSPSESGDVMVTTYDKNSSEIVRIRIPGDTQVNVSRQLGTWRIKSVWQLGENEKIGGRLLAETVTRNFRFPVKAWTGLKGQEEGSIGFDLSDSLSLFDTNLGLGDKISLALFSMGVKNFDKVEVDLVDSGYLDKKKLKDGEEGYVIAGDLPKELIVVFADPEIAEKGVRIVLKNASGRGDLDSEVGEILEVLGAKIAATFEENEEDIDCEIMGEDRKVVQKISSLFNCKTVGNKAEGNFDVEIVLGKKFDRRF